MGVPVLVKHDHGCKWSRAEDVQIEADGSIQSYKLGPAHSDEAKRVSDAYNLHRAAGTNAGWLAIALADGSSDGEIYASRQDAVATKWPRETWFFYVHLGQPSMTVCAAASLLRYYRIMSEMNGSHMDRDAPGGGLEVIPRLAAEDQEAQIEAIRSGRGMVALGRRR